MLLPGPGDGSGSRCGAKGGAILVGRGAVLLGRFLPRLMSYSVYFSLSDQGMGVHIDAAGAGRLDDVPGDPGSRG